jgi:hypothetical protein
MVCSMANEVGLTLPKAIAKTNSCRAEMGHKPITMNWLPVQAGVASTTIARLVPADYSRTSALSLDMTVKTLTALEVGIGDLIEAVE